MDSAHNDIRKQAYQLRQSFQYDQAKSLLQNALQAADEQRLPASLQWELHYDLAKAYQETYDPAAAEAHYQKALSLLEQEKGDCIFTARIWSSLGLLLQDEGRVNEAIDCHERAVHLLRQAPESQVLLYLASNYKYLGEMYQETGQLAKAREYYRPSLSYLQQRLGSGEGFLYLEAATVALLLVAVELELLVQGKGQMSAASVEALLSGARNWLSELEHDDSIVEQRWAEWQRLRFLLNKLV